MNSFSNKEVWVSDIIDCAKQIDTNVKYVGPLTISVFNCSSPNDLCDHDIIWLSNKGKASGDFFCKIKESDNLLIVCSEETMMHIDSTVKEYKGYIGWIITEIPRDVFFGIIDTFLYKKISCGGIGKNSVVETKRIDSTSVIGCNCYIGPDVIIGRNVVIHNNVVIECPTVIGDFCCIYSGVIIGAEGFGYYNKNNDKCHIPHLMGVVIGHHTEIGANTCIDRGCLVDTRIGNYVKIDNLVHIAHNVIIHDHAMIVAQAMLGGSSEYGERTYVAPGARVFDTVNVGNDVVIGVGAVVKNNVEDGKTVVGIPAREIRRVTK